jgi:hypothetical protein
MPGGPPPKYKSEEEVKTAIAAYFKDCEAKKLMPNKAGLCVFLKISRDN